MKNSLHQLTPYWRLYLLTLVLGLGGTLQYGIQVSVMTSPAEHIKSFVNETWLSRYDVPVGESTNTLIWSFMVSILSLGGLVGSMYCGSLSVRYGRKTSMQINNAVAIIAAVMMILSRVIKSFELILIGRFLYGFNVGLGINLHLLYLGESAPKQMRGFLSLTSSMFLSGGKLLGQVIGIEELMGTEDMWPYLLAVSGLPAILQFVSLLCFPEAPRSLYIDRGDEEGCKKALEWLWQEDNMNIKTELEDMRRERESAHATQSKTMLDVLRDRTVRWQLLALLIPCACLQFCGINAIYFYAFDIFRESGIPEEMMRYLSLGIGAMELITVSICAFLIDRTGRKKLLGYGYLLMGVMMSVLIVLLTIKDWYPWLPYFNIGLLFSVICVYGLGPAGGATCLPADLFLQAWRPSAFAIGGTVNWFSLFLIGMLFPFIVDGIGQFCFLIFVGYCTVAAVFMYFIPETKGKSPMEITDDFNKLNFKNCRTEHEKGIDVFATKL